MPVGAPRVDQVNVVVGDVAAAARFLVELGVNHEILHHGQLIVYANALGRAFPASWAAFGV